jgi:nucleoside-diphosphate-sugar epimerase
MRALVLGATGFIGSHVVRALLDRGHAVTALVRAGSPGMWRLAPLRDAIQVLPFPGPERGSLPKADLCFNLASHGVDGRSSAPESLGEGNLGIALRLMEDCVRCGVRRFIHAGSGFEYGNTGLPLDEGAPLRPASPYGMAKAAATEGVLRQAERLGLDAIVLRPFSAFGPMEGFHRFVPQLMRSLLEGETLALTPGEQVRDYLFVEDLARAFVCASEAPSGGRRVFNVCGSQRMSLRSFVELLCAAVHGRMELFRFGELPYRSTEMMFYVGDDRRFRERFGWAPELSVEEGLRRTHVWYARYRASIPFAQELR